VPLADFTLYKIPIVNNNTWHWYVPHRPNTFIKLLTVFTTMACCNISLTLYKHITFPRNTWHCCATHPHNTFTQLLTVAALLSYSQTSHICTTIPSNSARGIVDILTDLGEACTEDPYADDKRCLHTAKLHSRDGISLRVPMAIVVRVGVRSVHVISTVQGDRSG